MAGSLFPLPRPVRLFVGAAAALAAVVALCAATVGAYLSSSHWVEHSLDVRQELYEWRAAILEAETSVRGYVAGGQASFSESYDAALQRERAAAIATRALVDDNPSQAQNVEGAERHAQAVIDDLQGAVTLGKAAHRDEARARLDSSESKQRMDAFRTDIHNLRLEEERLLVARRGQATERGRLALAGAILLTLLSCGLLAVGWSREAAHERRVSGLATEALGRLKALSELAAALSEARTRSEVAGVIVEHGMRAAGADTCTLYEVDAAGTGLDLIGDRGVAPDVLEKIRRISETSGNPGTFATLRSGVATWAESATDYAKLYPALATMKAEGARARSFWSVPLFAEGRTLGLLGVGFYQPRRFSADERAFVETLTKHCAQALSRASRREGEDIKPRGGS